MNVNAVLAMRKTNYDCEWNKKEEENVTKFTLKNGNVRNGDSENILPERRMVLLDLTTG